MDLLASTFEIRTGFIW